MYRYNAALRSFVFLIVLVSFSCTESPIEPNGQRPEGYPVYFHSEQDPENWYIYYPESHYLDSIILPTSLAWRTAISHRGDLLFFSNSVGTGLLIIDLESGELLKELPWSVHSLDLSPDGHLLAVGHEGFSLVNTADLSVQFHTDSALLYRTTFSADGNTLLGAYDDTYGWSTVADPMTVTKVPIPIGSGISLGGRIHTSQLTNHWYVRSQPFFFVDWNVQADSASFVDTVFYNTTRYNSHISHNGRYVVYINDFHAAWNYTELRVYDTEAMAIVDTIDPIIYHESGDSTIFSVKEIAMTPDSKWLVGTSYSTPGYIMVYNIEELKIERFVEMQQDQTFINIACQTGE